MLSEKLIELRKKNKDTQENLSRKLSVSRSLIAKWEQGRAYPIQEYLEKICVLYNVDINDLKEEKIEEKFSIKKYVTYLSLIITGILSFIFIVSIVLDKMNLYKYGNLVRGSEFLLFVILLICVFFLFPMKIKNITLIERVVIPLLISLCSMILYFTINICIDLLFNGVSSLRESIGWKLLFIGIEFVVVLILNALLFNLKEKVKK